MIKKTAPISVGAVVFRRAHELRKTNKTRKITKSFTVCIGKTVYQDLTEIRILLG